jgi:hypothetical protein
LDNGGRQLRIFNTQDTLLKADLVQRLEEALLAQARTAQSEQAPNAFEHTRIRQERLDEAETTREARIREEKKRREPFLSVRKKREERSETPPENQPPAGGHIIDFKA